MCPKTVALPLDGYLLLSWNVFRMVALNSILPGRNITHMGGGITHHGKNGELSSPMSSVEKYQGSVAGSQCLTLT